jgi:hypothetical protein
MPLVASGDPVGCVARPCRLRSGRYRCCSGRDDNAARRRLGTAQQSMHCSGRSWKVSVSVIVMASKGNCW